MNNFNDLLSIAKQYFSSPRDVNSYSEMCSIFGMKPKSSKDKRLEDEELWNVFLDWNKSGRKYLNTTLTSNENIKKRMFYMSISSNLEYAICSFLGTYYQSTNRESICLTNKDLRYQLGLTNLLFSKSQKNLIPFAKELEDDILNDNKNFLKDLQTKIIQHQNTQLSRKSIGNFDIIDFNEVKNIGLKPYSNIKKEVNHMLNFIIPDSLNSKIVKALNHLEKDMVIMYDKYWVGRFYNQLDEDECNPYQGYFYERKLNPKEKNLLIKLYNQVMSDMGYSSLFEIKRDNKLLEYYRKLNPKLKEMGIIGFYPVFEISFSGEFIGNSMNYYKFIPSSNRLLNIQQLYLNSLKRTNNEFKKSLKNNSKIRNKSNNPDDVLGDNIGDVIKTLNYIDDKIVDKVISISPSEEGYIDELNRFIERNNNILEGEYEDKNKIFKYQDYEDMGVNLLKNLRDEDL